MKPSVLVLAFALAAPTAALAAPSSTDPSQCFSIRTINNRFVRTGTHTVNIGVNGNQVWALEWRGPCGSIDWTLPATLRSRSGASLICRGGDVDIVASAPLGARYCQVVSIRRLSEAEISALPKKDRP
jgi:hypothetical protein